LDQARLASVSLGHPPASYDQKGSLTWAVMLTDAFSTTRDLLFLSRRQPLLWRLRRQGQQVLWNSRHERAFALYLARSQMAVLP